jgi:Tol biopolymer transport system component
MNNRDIFLLSVDGAQESRLIDHPSLDYVLGWTADGTHLLFGSERTGDRGAWIIRIEDGEALGPPRLVKSGIGPAYPLGITRDNQFYYAYNLQTSDVYTTEIDPESGRILAAPKIVVRHYEGNNFFPDYSPDGKYLAYTSLRNSLPMGSNSICIYSLENGDIKELDPGLGRFDYPQWRPDGKAVSLEGSDKDGRKGIYLIEIESDQVSPIVQIADDERIFAHRWSVDGRTLFYTKGKERADDSRIFKHEVRTGMSEILPGSPDDAKDIDVSPDGEMLVLLNRSRKERRSLRVMPSGGGDPRELYSFETEGDFIITPAWSPDGEYIFFPKPPATADAEELVGGAPADDLWRFSIKDQQAQMLDIKMSRIRHLSAHSDGRHIAFSSFGRDLQFSEIWLMENFQPKADDQK